MSEIVTFWSDPLAKYYISAVLGLYPAARICLRAGLHPAGAVLLLVPFVGLLAWTSFLAIRPWRKGVNNG